MEEFTHQIPEEVIVFTSADQALIDTCSLVLSAKNIRHRIGRLQNGEVNIHVPVELGEKALYQLDRFFIENRNWPPRDTIPDRDSFPVSAPTIVLIGCLAFFYMITGPWHHSSPWFQAGGGDATAILHGEWFRLVTALTLHADFSHLAGNCLVGAFLVYFFLQINGAGLGLLAILVSAATGNLINVLAHGGDHLFVGFSTAVFSIIGMLSMYQIMEQRKPFGIRMLVPFMAGAALLAMLGSSGERTDLGSHLFGLLSGFLMGLFLGTRYAKTARKSSFLQACSLIAFISVVIICWNTALAFTSPFPPGATL